MSPTSRGSRQPLSYHCPPPRTKWTRLVPPPVLIGHVSLCLTTAAGSHARPAGACRYFDPDPAKLRDGARSHLGYFFILAGCVLTCAPTLPLGTEGRTGTVGGHIGGTIGGGGSPSWKTVLPTPRFHSLLAPAPLFRDKRASVFARTPPATKLS